MEKYSNYTFEIKKSWHSDDSPFNAKGRDVFYYEIYSNDIDYINWMRTNVLRESEEWFDTEQEARFAAIGHIDLLENGEG